MPVHRELLPTPSPYLPIRLDRIRDDAILNAMAYFNGSVNKAAEILGISRQTLHNHLKVMGFVTGNNAYNEE